MDSIKRHTWRIAEGRLISAGGRGMAGTGESGASASGTAGAPARVDGAGGRGRRGAVLRAKAFGRRLIAVRGAAAAAGQRR